MKKIFFIPVVGLIFASLGHAQIPTATLIKIAKAEDARAYDKSLEDLMKSPNADIRKRAALAAGRIGNDAAVTFLAELLEKDSDTNVREMAAFAIGEIESIKGADAILETLKAETRVLSNVPGVETRLVEAAGKIAAANPKDEKAKALGASILDILRRDPLAGETARLAITAALRARPEGADVAVAKFLTDKDARIRSDAANTLTRLRAKNANETLRKMLVSDADAVARSNAARALGSAEDKDAVDILLNAATTDQDSRVRVSAIRSLALLKDAKASDKLIKRGETLLKQITIDPSVLRLASKPVPSTKPVRNSVETSELLEIATAIGRLLPNSRNEKAINFLDRLITINDGRSAEIAVARLRVAPGKFSARNEMRPLSNWRQYSTLAQILGEFSKVDATTAEAKKMKEEAPGMARLMARSFLIDDSQEAQKFVLAAPDFLLAFAEYKTDDLPEVMRDALKNKDLFIRAAAAGILADQPASKENIDALKTAFAKAVETDKYENDAQLAILDTLAKLDKDNMRSALYAALDMPDYLVRKKAIEILKTINSEKGLKDLQPSNALIDAKLRVYPYIGGRTKLGQVLNRDADYRRVLSRKNGSVKAVLATVKGTFTIVFNPEDAPLTVDNWVKLARSGYFNGLEVHRVVPNFVMQDGDPRGDGNGGPGWSIRCEVNMLSYDRGAVGMALSGKDTGGSQWFVTHSPQPHLDGGYTVFGHVDEAGMKVVDNIVRGDKILKVTIVGK